MMTDAIWQFISPMLSGLAGKYGTFAQVLLWIGTFRLVFKPLVTYAQTFVAATPTDKDNQWLAAAMNSSVYKGLVFVVDLLTSIKLPKV